MRVNFVKSVLEKLIRENTIRLDESILAVCAGSEEKDLFLLLQCNNVTISNLDNRVKGDEFSPLRWSFQDAQNLSFPDNSFDFTFVSDGLHHCQSPHRALLEMYRVARKGVIVFEGRDSLLMRIANRLKLVSEYELEAVVDNGYRFGGVNNTEIPNYIYRWTERELKKTILSYNPTGIHKISHFYGLELPYQTSSMRKSSLKSNIVRLVAPALTVSAHIFRRLNNLFATVVLKPQVPTDLWPWLEYHDGAATFNRRYADSLFRPSIK